MAQELKTYEKGFYEEGGFICFKHSFPAGTKFPQHWHDYIELEFIVSGTAKHVLNKEEYSLERGNAHILNYYDFHEVTATSDIVIYCIHFDESILNPKIIEFLNYNNYRCKFTEEEFVKIVEIIENLIAEETSTDELRSIMIKNLIHTLIISIMRKSSSSQMAPAPLPIQQAISYLKEHFYEKVTLEKMAKQLNYSANYIGKLFKSQMKCSFNDYVNSLRLRYACSLLYSSGISIKEISSAAGFSSIEYFMYTFKKNMLMTPGEYRKLKKKNQLTIIPSSSEKWKDSRV